MKIDKCRYCRGNGVKLAPGGFTTADRITCKNCYGTGEAHYPQKKPKATPQKSIKYYKGADMDKLKEVEPA